MYLTDCRALTADRFLLPELVGDNRGLGISATKQQLRTHHHYGEWCETISKKYMTVYVRVLGLLLCQIIAHYTCLSLLLFCNNA